MEPGAILACLVASVAAVSDVRHGRVPNWLTYSGLLAGLVLPVAFLDMHGLRSAALGLLIAGGPFLAAFLIGGAGGGDVKLMTALGALVGFPMAMDVMFLALLVAGTVVVIRRIWQIDIQAIWMQLKLVALAAPAGLRMALTAARPAHSRARRTFRFAPAAAVATLWFVLVPGLRPWPILA